MKLSYTDLQAQFLRNINFVGSLDTNIIADFNLNLGNRYQLIQAKLANYITQNQTTLSTVANQQYYDYPLGIMDIENVVVTVGNVNYPCDVINSQYNWNILNAIQIQASAIPQFIFPRSPYLPAASGGGFGIWPVPQAVYTVTFYQHGRTRNLSVDDYTTGTVSLTNGSGTITGSGTTFISPMVGRFLQVTDVTNPGYGYWYLISGYSSATSLSMVPTWQGTTGSGLTYRIGEVPNLPDEGNIILCDGATADFFGGIRLDVTKFTWWNNKFWTGDPNNAARDEGNVDIAGGLIGMMNRYAERNNPRLIQTKPKLSPLNYQVWATTLS